MRTILATLHSKYIHNSLALPCIAAYCGDACGELLIREFTTHEPKGSILAQLLAEQPDVISFSVYIWNRRETFELVDAIHVAAPNVRIVLGGPEVSFDGPTLFADHPGISALIRGEGEQPMQALLSSWRQQREPKDIPRSLLRSGGQIISGPETPALNELDNIPSPFAAGLVDLQRGFVYYETSRGCPFRCSFCLSARDQQVRSYSMQRIKSDLLLLMQQEVPKIKLVDRTFNYHAQRSKEIFRFILEHNISSHFHFEIAAHLLDQETLTLLERAPEGMFQFEIGVQSTTENTLDAIDRKVSLVKLEETVRHLREQTKIHLHLDLVAGLPGEGYRAFLGSIDRVAALKPHHLQIEPVKLLPGAPLRDKAQQHQIGFDPNPPYTILSSNDWSFDDLQRVQSLSRLLDLTWNSDCFDHFLAALGETFTSLSRGLEWLATDWRNRDLFRLPISRRNVFEEIYRSLLCHPDEQGRIWMIENLAYDFARNERVVINRVPKFFDTDLNPQEQIWVKETITQKTEQIRGQGIKLQYFAAAFNTLPHREQRLVVLFCYLNRSGAKMRVEEYSY